MLPGDRHDKAPGISGVLPTHHPEAPPRIANLGEPKNVGGGIPGWGVGPHHGCAPAYARTYAPPPTPARVRGTARAVAR